MQKRLSVLLSAAVALSACSGGEKQTSLLTHQGEAGLVYSYPLTEQQEVPTHAPVVLRFSEPLLNEDPASQIVLRDQNGAAVAYQAAVVDEGRGLVLTPVAALAPNTRYTVEATDLVTASGAIPWSDSLAFTTRSAVEGTRSQLSKGDFTVSRLIPDGDQLPLMDFSTLRLQFTQPLDVRSVRYGETLTLLDASGEPVAASLIVQGPYISIDPVEDLQAGASYQLKLDSSLTSSLGDALNPGEYAEFTLTPKNSHPREIMAQRAGDSMDGSLLSVLSGAPINAVPVKALLLGDQSMSQQQGDVHAELAFVPNYPEVTPLRIDRSSLLVGSSVNVEVAGRVPAGFETGDINVTFISDANGYLIPNQYSNDEAAPRHIRLFLDLAMTAENEKANGALSQDLLHVELAGTAIVQNGIMVIDAIGVVEPKVLGLDQAYGVLSFHMEAYRDQINAPAPAVDDVAPFVQSWVPGPDHQGKQRPGDPIIVTFSEPLDRNSLVEDGAWNLLANDTPVTTQWRLDGSSLVIQPEGGLQFGRQYELQFTAAVRDLSGNALIAPSERLTFALPRYLNTSIRAPLVLTSTPGYPCAKVDINLTQGHQGRCNGGVTNASHGNNDLNPFRSHEDVRRPHDDLIPILDHPASRPLVATFTQNLKPESVTLGKACNDSATFRVERVNTAGVCQEAIPGKLTVEARRITFTPEQPWAQGELYRYVLGSQPTATPNCSGTGAICSIHNLALQTALLSGPADKFGGAPIEQYFRGGQDVGTVFNPLRNFPTVDVNSNLIDSKSGEAEAALKPNEELSLQNTTRVISNGKNGRQSGLAYVSTVKVGNCGSSRCAAEEFVTMTAALDTEVIGYDPVEDAVRVKLYPTILATSGLDLQLTIRAASIIPLPIHSETGPQVMRMRYQEDEQGNRTQLIDGYIRETPDGPIFTTVVDAYMDAPYLEPPLSAKHNQYSLPIKLNLTGAVTFFEDGRMQIIQRNIEPVDLPVRLIALGQTLSVGLEIPANGVYLNYVSKFTKQ